MEIIWLRPHGSKREGMRKMSAPAYIRRESGSEKRIWALNRPGCRASARGSSPHTPVARAERDGDLRAGEHFLRHGVEKIEALLLRQTADAHAKGNFTIDGEAELLLQRLLVPALPSGSV